MTSSYTARNGILKQATGDNTNNWGDLQSSGDFDVLDYALDGWAQVNPTGGVTLSLSNGATSGNANARALKLITAAAPATVTLTAREHWYLIWNSTAVAHTIACAGGGTSVNIGAAEVVFVGCDAVNVVRLTLSTMTTALDMGSHKITSITDPTSPQDACTKAYADALAFGSFAGTFPAQVGNAGKFTQTDGSAVSWQWAVTQATGLASISTNTLTVTGSTASQIRVGTNSNTAATPVALTGSAAFITLTDAATIAWDVSTGYNASVTLGGNRVIGAPTNLQDGITYSLELVQDATGTRVPTWNAIWDFGAAGTPVLQTTAAKADKVYAQYNARTGKLDASFRKGA